MIDIALTKSFLTISVSSHVSMHYIPNTQIRVKLDLFVYIEESVKAAYKNS